MTAQERAGKVAEKYWKKGWKTKDELVADIAAELDSYAEEKHKNCMGAEVEGCATWVRIERLETAKAEGRRAGERIGLMRAAQLLDVDADRLSQRDGGSALALQSCLQAQKIRALITTEANEGEKK